MSQTGIQGYHYDYHNYLSLLLISQKLYIILKILLNY